MAISGNVWNGVIAQDIDVDIATEDVKSLVNRFRRIPKDLYTSSRMGRNMIKVTVGAMNAPIRSTAIFTIRNK